VFCWLFPRAAFCNIAGAPGRSGRHRQTHPFYPALENSVKPKPLMSAVRWLIATLGFDK
jgi:hypothetical protein